MMAIQQVEETVIKFADQDHDFHRCAAVIEGGLHRELLFDFGKAGFQAVNIATGVIETEDNTGKEIAGGLVIILCHFTDIAAVLGKAAADGGNDAGCSRATDF
ncbi:hypothetical protein APC31_17370 [Acinetobacter baumannii]|nr:hypothetical protein APC31_17370 [Acinetobacter baumannii]